MVNLNKIIGIIIITFCFVQFSFSSSARTNPNHRQKGAKVNYINPKYVGDAVAFTSRARRNKPYLTNVTITFLTSIGNNVTIRVQHNMKHSPLDLEIVWKVCETHKTKWINDFVLKFSDVDTSKCPFPAKTYHTYNMMFEADKILIPMPQGVNEITFVLEITDTKELICKISLALEIY